ncbi:MAG: alpha/beta hydrolase [Rhodospirillaceae bacterium TMED8]|nr:alpha/beta hydrolase [Magnetovibrio sp.]OUT47769.1 MAG: alpha/beta hydrolase [Rhodospirillaceae bacterium TMED8]
MDDPNAMSKTLCREDGATIAYYQIPGKQWNSSPGVVFLSGFKSDMTGLKAMAVETLCKRLGHPFLRFDYFGHGQSSGKFEDGTIGRWTEDAIFVIDELTDGPQVLVGSSMGGWIMLLVALARPERIAGLVGLAAAPDFTEDLIPAALSTEQMETLARDGEVAIPNCYDEEPYLIRKEFLEEAREHLVLRNSISIPAPIRLIHGMQDNDVPWRTGLKIAEKMDSDDIEMIYVKTGDHRLSGDQDIKRLKRTLSSLLEDLS